MHKRRVSIIAVSMLVAYFLLTGGWMFFLGSYPQWEVTNNYYGEKLVDSSLKVELKANGVTDTSGRAWLAPWQSTWESSSPYVIIVSIEGPSDLVRCRMERGTICRDQAAQEPVAELNFEPNTGVLTDTGLGWYRLLHVGDERWAAYHSAERRELTESRYFVQLVLEVETKENVKSYRLSIPITMQRRVMFHMVIPGE